MKSYDFLFWGYNTIWIGIAAYVAFMVVRLKRVGERLDRLEARLRDRPGPGA